MSQDVIQLAMFASGYSVPVDIAHAGDNRLFVVEKRGTIKIVDTTGQKWTEPFLDITDLVRSSESERGLLGMCFHPAYSSNGYFYLNYTRKGDGSTVIARYNVDSLDQEKADPSSAKVLLVVSQPYSNHNAGDLEFGPDGYLYIGLGDGGSGNDPENRSQNRLELLGKMLRIDVDEGDPYGIPMDNPYVDDSLTLNEIWAIGLRNPWRYSFDRVTGDFYIADVGQSNREEVNVEAFMSAGGANYGWRCYEGNHAHITMNCEEEDAFTFPAFAYAHEGFNCSGSITGGYVYRGSQNPDLYGQYIFTDYCTGKFRSWSPNDSTARIILSGSTRSYTTFGEDASGEIYVASGNGNIYRINQTTSSLKLGHEYQNIALYPVPARGKIFIGDGSFFPNILLNVNVYNSLGINVISTILNSGDGLDISSLTAGIHFLTFDADGKYFVGKFILQ